MYRFPGATFLIALRDWETTVKFTEFWEPAGGKRHATLTRMVFPPQGLFWWVLVVSVVKYQAFIASLIWMPL